MRDHDGKAENAAHEPRHEATRQFNRAKLLHFLWFSLVFRDVDFMLASEFFSLKIRLTDSWDRK